MRIFSKAIVLAAAVAACGVPDSSAVPAKPGLLTMTQPDGTTVGVRIVGDEFHHFYLSEDGYLLVNDNETFYYADVDDAGRPVRSGIEASDPQSRSAEAERYLSAVDMDRVLASMENRRRLGVTRRAARRGPGLFPGAHFPATGEQKAIVILVEYSDVDMSLDEPLDYFSRMLSQEGFSDYGGTGSARDYFIECSHGLFVPEFDVFGPVRLPNTRAYYGANDFYGDDVRPADMIIEACQALDDEVDFSEYDRDGDGFIDNVFVFYAGAGEASGGPATSVWPHSWNVTAATATPYLFDGVQLDRYACTNEWVGHRPDGVGTFIHEFSHVIGLPDLYATSYTSSFTPGSWSALDSGPYNNNGCTPPLYSAFERYSLGWLEPVEIDGPVSATLLPISENVAGIIRTGDDNEYFLLENRQQAGWDAYIPGHGMLVWHIDYDADVWEQNIVNNKSTHQYVDIEEADDSRTDKSRAGDAFPGTANVTSLTDDTRPGTLTWDGQRLDRPITGIAESEAGIITFDVLGGSALPASTAADEADEVGVDGFTARWQAADPDSEYVLSVYTKGQNSDLSRTATADNIAYLPGFNHRRVGRVNSYAVTGVESGVAYYYSVCVADGLSMSLPSNEICVDYTAVGSVGGLAVSASRPAIAPCDGEIAITGAEPGASVTVADVAGRMVRSGRIGSDGTWRVSRAASGVYVVQICGADRFTAKVLLPAQ